jgi:pimeloyl-ACP methyl ester carboxylesterase
MCGWRCLAARIIVAIATLTHSADASAADAHPINATCVGEQAAFSSFIRSAASYGKPDLGFQPTGTLKFIQHRSRADGTLLQGFEAGATNASGTPVESRGVVLFVQGNAMFVDQILEELQEIAKHGYDVVSYDFRGYGRSSDGVASLRGIVSDYEEIISDLRERKTGKQGFHLFVMALSAGGMFVLGTDALARDADAVVLDSVPANVDRNIRLLFLFSIFKIECPESVQPESRLPEDMSRFLWYQGMKDRLVRATDAKQVTVLKLAESRHATVVYDPYAGHVLGDCVAATVRRFARAIGFFDSKGANVAPEGNVSRDPPADAEKCR